MVTKQQIVTRLLLLIGMVVVMCVALVTVSNYGFGIASAGSGANDSALNANITFTSNTASDQVSDDATDEQTPSESLILTSATKRDMSAAIQEIEDEEEQERIAAEEAARADELAHIQRAEAAKARAYALSTPVLPDVDFSCGKEAFLAEWTARLNNYLAGSALAGRGGQFAAAAWEYGVDPRWSAAISNTESTKGANCFRSYNAWGWMGAENWTSWDQSIDAHARGLATKYGFTISVANAHKYCPPTYLDWYQKTLSEMAKI